jgi:hypothetical protein
MPVKIVILLLTFAALLTGCATGGFDSAQKTQQLRVGMAYSEVISLLGEPLSTEVTSGKLLAAFPLHQSWKGNVVYDLTFNADTRTLLEWSENEERYLQNQMQLDQISKLLSPSNKGGAGTSAPSGPNNPQLQQQIAGIWWGYAGSTERKLGLCANGSYQDYTESGYSGRSHDAGGNETMAWGSASQGGGSGQWTINGDTQSGTISVTYSDGSSASVKYRQVGEPGCLDFNGARLCRSSASCE